MSPENFWARARLALVKAVGIWNLHERVPYKVGNLGAVQREEGTGSLRTYHKLHDLDAMFLELGGILWKECAQVGCAILRAPHRL